MTPRNAKEIALLKSLKLHKEDASCQWIGEFQNFIQKR